MLWFLKFLKYLPRAMLAFRKDFKLSKRCERIEDKEGPIAGAIFMYDKLVDEVKPMLIGDLLTYLESTDYEEPNPVYASWLGKKGIEYGFIKPLPEVKSQTNEAWREWEMQE